MLTHKSGDYKLSAIKYYLYHYKNQMIKIDLKINSTQ